MLTTSKPSPSQPPSVVQGAASIVGNVVVNGEVHFDGELQGDLYARQVIVGERGKIIGAICAEEVIVRGLVMGSIRTAIVFIQSTAQVEGDIIYSGSVSIEQGAFHEGRTRRVTAEQQGEWLAKIKAARAEIPVPLAITDPAAATEPGRDKDSDDQISALPAQAQNGPTADSDRDKNFVFISYSKVDRAIAERLARSIQDRGYNAWFDADLDAGKSFANVIKQQLQRAGAIIVVWSKSSSESNWVYSEADYALRRGILLTLHCVDFDPQDAPMPFNSLHAESVDNIEAICRALRGLGVRAGPAT